MVAANAPSDAADNARRWEESAQRWAETADERYPARGAFWDLFTAEMAAAFDRPARVLELGSGPGFLAQRILVALPVASYTLVDVSPAMHRLAKARLSAHADKTVFVTADYGGADWTGGLDRFDALVSLQAVHEVRHKDRVPGVYRALQPHLDDGAVALICDRYISPDHPGDESLHMTLAEHERALADGGFRDIRLLHKVGELALFRAVRA